MDRAVGAERQGWLDSTGEELKSFEEKKVIENCTMEELYSKYGKNHVKVFHSEVVATKKPILSLIHISEPTRPY